MPLALTPYYPRRPGRRGGRRKASLNLPQGRNLIGTVHQPVAVIADVALAAAQPEREYRAGLAEIVKHALISDAGLVELLREDVAGLRGADVGTLTELVARSAAVKAAIVSTDEREQGVGYISTTVSTFGHAIEQVRGPDCGDDGEAVALGMMAAAYLARLQGRIPDELVDLHRSCPRICICPQTPAGLT